MFGIRHMKASPTTFVMLWKGEKKRRAGLGLSFLYFAPTSTLVSIDLASRDVPFAFEQATSDFQQVSIQGQLTYRVAEPERLGALLDFSLDARGRYQSDDPTKLTDRLMTTAQVLTQGFCRRHDLRALLGQAEALSATAVDELRKSEVARMHGLEVLGFSVSAIRPTPEMGRALEAEAREALQRQADGAVYERRNAAVEQERRIKESELSTELAVEAKRRSIREAKMAADVAVETARTGLLAKKNDNDRQEADARAYALRAQLEPLKETDWRTLMAAGGNQDPRFMLAFAFRELAENAGKIGELHLSPELLQSLSAAAPGKKG